MGAHRGFSRSAAMASRWRRRPMCVLIADAPAPAALREISARGALLDTNSRPEIGGTVELRHPEAGTIEGRVRAHSADGIAIQFDCGARSAAFALAAIAADMSRPA
ncbi:MAG: hypothetical protein ACK4K7_07835 [Allosphingosinicella sp.]|uniref:hypothetical protein n=1 Tax=Allosphingosinicella sp. TaxID=2823234 RepID=UPI00394C9A11